MTHASLHGVILAGGSGTRLWPLSTQSRPKQFLSVGSMPPLLSQTVERLSSLLNHEKLWVVCGGIHEAGVKGLLPQLPAGQILIEPQAKNTAAAIALAAIYLRHQDPQAIMVVLPADHYIPQSDWKLFCQNLELAAAVARERNALITLGVSPKYPALGYGYIEQGEKFEMQGQTYFKVKSFREKPKQQTAEAYFKSGAYCWNSGIFIWQARTYLEALQQTCPETAKIFEEIEKNLHHPNVLQIIKDSFAKLENISVDYAVLEKANNVFMVPANFGWEDMGSLTSFEKMLSRDENGNAIQGEVFAVDATHNMVIAQSKPVALLGVENLLVIETPQAILILPKEKAEEVKQMVATLKQCGREDLL